MLEARVDARRRRDNEWVEALLPGNRETEMGQMAREQGPQWVADVFEESRKHTEEAVRFDERRKVEGELAEARRIIEALLVCETSWDAPQHLNAVAEARAYLARTQPARPRAEDAQEEKPCH